MYVCIFHFDCIFLFFLYWPSRLQTITLSCIQTTKQSTNQTFTFAFNQHLVISFVSDSFHFNFKFCLLPLNSPFPYKFHFFPRTYNTCWYSYKQLYCLTLQSDTGCCKMRFDLKQNYLSQHIFLFDQFLVFSWQKFYYSSYSYSLWLKGIKSNEFHTLLSREQYQYIQNIQNILSHSFVDNSKHSFKS